MPSEVAAFLIHYSNELWMAFLGVLGGTVRVAVGDEKMSAGKIFAVLVTGGVLAGTSGPLFTSWMGMGPEATSFCSFIVGIMGMNIVKHAIDMEVGGLFSKQKTKR